MTTTVTTSTTRYVTHRNYVKGCPFCDQQPELVHTEFSKVKPDWTLWCINRRCPVTVEVTAGSREDVVRIWNTRPT